MNEVVWIAVLLIAVLLGGILLAVAAFRWRRKRLAARLADHLLEDVLRVKDAFRR